MRQKVFDFIDGMGWDFNKYLLKPVEGVNIIHLACAQQAIEHG